MLARDVNSEALQKIRGGETSLIFDRKTTGTFSLGFPDLT